MQFETADFHPRIEESVNQLDSLIINGDYWLDESKREAIGELLASWSRIHASRLVSFAEMQAAGEL